MILKWAQHCEAQPICWISMTTSVSGILLWLWCWLYHRYANILDRCSWHCEDNHPCACTVADSLDSLWGFTRFYDIILFCGLNKALNKGWIVENVYVRTLHNRKIDSAGLNLRMNQSARPAFISSQASDKLTSTKQSTWKYDSFLPFLHHQK